MMLRVGGLLGPSIGTLAAILILAPVMGGAGDGTFGVPPSGILLPPPPMPARIAPAKMPTQTAALIPPERAAPEKVIAPRRVQQTYSPAPADGAGRSRVAPPSEVPVHSPVIAPPKHKRFKAPTASVDPDYVDSVAHGEPRSLSAPAPGAAPVVAQGAAPEQKRGLFNMLRNRNAGVQTAQAQTAPMQIAPVYATPSTSAASAAYAEYTAAPVQTAPIAAPAPAQPRSASRLSFGGTKPGARANDGTPCTQLRGIFTSPPECR
jgi:hypothetical protein